MLLEVTDLRTHFRLADGRVAPAVDGVSFGLDAGETLGLVGESGCGKSVTAFSILRLLPANSFHPSGRIALQGRDLLGLSESEMCDVRGDRMAMIFQEPMTSLNPLMRVGRQLMEPLELHRGMPRPAARDEALRLLRQVGIPAPEQRLRDFPHQLSGGMRQRIMIAMALACRPDVLIADEPTTSLDVTIQAQILGLMKDLQAETGMAILFITHDLGIVNQIADRVTVMYGGKTMECGPRAAVFTNMAHPYTRGLFASIPALSQKGHRLRAIPGNVPAATAYPAGCRFSDRCRECFARCLAEDSPLHPVGEGHQAACHRLEPGSTVSRDPAAWMSTETRTGRDLTRAGDALLRVDGLRTHFPVKRGVLLRTVAHVRAVDGVSFRLMRGGTLALVGESGCGKTTVGFSLLRLLREASGTVVFQGESTMGWDRRRMRAMRQRMQIVFQDPFSSLSPRLTVGRIVGEGLRVHFPRLGRVEREARVAQAIEEVGLDPSCLGRYPHEFSGGQRQRISIARALVLKPDFLVLDEPASALDVSVQAQILNLLVDLQAEHGLTYLFITHDLGVVRYMADAVAVMYLGRIVEQASCERLFAQPLHPYTQSLLHAVPKLGERVGLVRLRGEVPSPLHPPPGCHFHPRCPAFAAAASSLAGKCPVLYPELRDVGGEHLVACHAAGG
ncbi:MAG: Glutathione import ATP-binding protein GsiA [Lentisphaerae bacterium ADurb.BinA184]|nr:MAG: Glutathione import ATP-binding protein GsiA [Lentisphaerae bacterium ADurb.BinA184]